MSRPLLFFVLGALCAMGALLITEPDPDDLLDREATRMQARMAGLQAGLTSFAEQHAQLLSAQGPRSWMSSHAEATEAEQRRSGSTLHIFVEDSLVAWSGNVPFAPEALLGAEGAHFLHGRNVFLHTSISVGSLNVHALRPVWLSPPVINRYLREGFHPSVHAPSGLLAELGDGSGPVIEDAEKEPLFRLAWSDGAIELGAWLSWRMALLALASILSLAALWMFCMRLVRSGRAGGGSILFVAGLALLRSASLTWGATAPFDRWPLFDPAIYATSAAFPSLGDLLINALLLVAAGAFLHSAARSVRPFPSAAAAFLITGSVLLHAAWTTHLCTGLVSDSSIDLDLYHVQGIGAFGAVALFAMALLMGAWYLIASAAVRALLPSAHPLRTAVASGIALVLSIIVHHHLGIVDTILFLWPVPVIGLLVIGRHRPPSFLHSILVIGLFAATSTHMLTKYMREREQRERVALADRIAAREDPVVEQLFREEAPVLRRDTAIYRLFTGKATCGPGELEAIVRQPYFSGYWERYDIRLFGFGPQGDVRCATDLDPPRSSSDGTLAFPSGVSDTPELVIDDRSGGDIFYHARIAVMPHDSVAPAQLVVELRPRSLSQGLGFPELLLAGDDAVARRAERYVQARYVNGTLMEQNGRVPQPWRWAGKLDNEGESWYTANGYEYLAKAVGGGTIMVLGLPHRGLVDKATTFSYLFICFGLLTLLALTMHALFTRAVPFLGIGTKVRAALVLFAIIGLVLFGIGSQRLLSRQFTQRAETASLEKARSVRLELQRRLGDERVAGEAHAAYLEHLIGQLGNSFFTDITVYAPDGRLLASSRPQMFSSGLLGPRMDAIAFARLAIDGQSTLVHGARIGDAEYRTAYVPLLDRAGAVLAHIALPSFADQAQQEEERSDLLIAVMNLFVLLFALSMLLAVFISNWTTRPLDVLKRSLAGMALGGGNQPLRYRGKDEVGELVAVYNRKVDELRESAEKLARSERESAWREMARQVAHEVKNPLTPMKLGIQQFQRTWDPEAPDAKERLDRFTKSMVEQIDTLNGVATAFSQFAQMPAASPADLDLCEVVRSAVDVFHATPGIAITHRESGPLPVHADREHMLRVVNNLLKNAVQAIPEGREGRVEVVTRSGAGSAIIEVRDNGTGIPEGTRDRIFTPSFTTKSSGMGLGLAMVKRMVEGAGGRVWFESEEEAGTSFFVELPLRG